MVKLQFSNTICALHRTMIRGQKERTISGTGDVTCANVITVNERLSTWALSFKFRAHKSPVRGCWRAPGRHHCKCFGGLEPRGTVGYLHSLVIVCWSHVFHFYSTLPVRPIIPSMGKFPITIMITPDRAVHFAPGVY